MATTSPKLCYSIQVTMNKHLFSHHWNLSDGYPAKGIEHHGCKVFGTFICGGGSSMGYKLAGYDHLGGVEIDPAVAETYRINHHPEYLYIEDLRDFNRRTDLPAELYQIDILDGSPPCSTFSMAGDRDKAWGKQKHFAEGQKLQTLDDLVFVYCETILKLQPKVFILENVKGIIAGNAKSYTKRVADYLFSHGYTVQIFCLNSATMGVPQARERVFFIGHKKEYKLPSLKLNFNESPITFSEVKSDRPHDKLTATQLAIWYERRYGDKNMGDTNIRLIGKANLFNSAYLYLNKCCPTLTSTTAQNRSYFHFDEPLRINEEEILSISTFPQDYQSPTKDIGWLCGMSVPPIMTAQISYQIWKQWLSNIKNKSTDS